MRPVKSEQERVIARIAKCERRIARNTNAGQVAAALAQKQRLNQRLEELRGQK